LLLDVHQQGSPRNAGQSQHPDAAGDESDLGGTFHSIGIACCAGMFMDFGTSRDSPSWTGKIRKISCCRRRFGRGRQQTGPVSEGGSLGDIFQLCINTDHSVAQVIGQNTIGFFR